jgi:hypothetical protein
LLPTAYYFLPATKNKHLRTWLRVKRHAITYDRKWQIAKLGLKLLKERPVSELIRLRDKALRQK